MWAVPSVLLAVDLLKAAVSHQECGLRWCEHLVQCAGSATSHRGMAGAGAGACAWGSGPQPSPRTPLPSALTSSDLGLSFTGSLFGAVFQSVRKGSRKINVHAF